MMTYYYNPYNMTSFTRTQVEYTEKEKEIIKKNINTLQNQINIKSANKVNELYDNQIYTASNINKFFNNDSVISISLYSRTQCGKTGCMVFTIYY